MNLLRPALLVSLGLLVGCAGDPEPAKDASSDDTSRPVEKAKDTSAEPERRRFRIDYVTKVAGAPVGETIRLWIPIPSDSPHQTIGEIDVSSPIPYRETREEVWGNRMLYLEGKTPQADFQVRIRYEVSRAVAKTDFGSREASLKKPSEAHFYSPALLVRDDSPIQIAHQEATREGDALTKAKGYYDYVLDRMTYDKSGKGWGRGDSTYACRVGKGNCTDYHALFQGLCMKEKIPTRFSIGLYGKFERQDKSYTTGGYHCWAEFWIEGQGWIPIDASEADKNPSRADFFFGGLTDNRVTLSRGRDLVLEPAQKAEPLNFFVNPYAEVDGHAFQGVGKAATWTDLD